jgi:capsular polysaccharide transport system permease protein
VPSDDKSIAVQVAEYQDLSLSADFAQKAYEVAQASLERARSDTAQTQSYLAIFMNPSVPEYSVYPRRFLDVTIVFLLASIGWALGTLGVLAFREYLV